MIQKQQWVILPLSVASSLPGLRLSPPGVIPQRDRRPRWIGDYSWSQVNQETAPLAPMEAMQYGHALDRIIRNLVLADPRFGPTHIFKADIADGFYRVNLRIPDIPKLGLVPPPWLGIIPSFFSCKSSSSIKLQSGCVCVKWSLVKFVLRESPT